MPQLLVDDILSITANYSNNFDLCKKVFVLSPPRNASTIFSLLLNLNPKFYVWCESGINWMFSGSMEHYSRLTRVSKLRSSQLSNLIVYKNKGLISFKDFLIFIFQHNPKMRHNIENKLVIGDKTPQISGKIELMQYFNDNIPNCYFPGTLKTDLQDIIKSVVRAWVNENKIRSKERITDDISRFAKELLDFVVKLNKLILSKKYNSINIFDYSDFVADPGKTIDYVYNEVLGKENDFVLGKYQVEKYEDKLYDLLTDSLLGYRGHVYMSGGKTKDGLMKHQLGLLKEVKASYMKYDDNNWIDMFNDISALPIMHETISEYNSIMKSFPFTKINGNK